MTIPTKPFVPLGATPAPHRTKLDDGEERGKGPSGPEFPRTAAAGNESVEEEASTDTTVAHPAPKLSSAEFPGTAASGLLGGMGKRKTPRKPS